MLVACQIAFYLGFEQIYILGADLGFKESSMQKLLKKTPQRLGQRLGIDNIFLYFDRNHFSPSYGTPGYAPEIQNRNMVAAHQLTKALGKNVV